MMCKRISEVLAEAMCRIQENAGEIQPDNEATINANTPKHRQESIETTGKAKVLTEGQNRVEWRL